MPSAHLRIAAYTTPIASTSALSLTLRSSFSGSNDQKQALVNAFSICSCSLPAAPSSYEVARREFAIAKVHIYFLNKTIIAEKNYYSQVLESYREDNPIAARNLNELKTNRRRTSASVPPVDIIKNENGQIMKTS